MLSEPSSSRLPVRFVRRTSIRSTDGCTSADDMEGGGPVGPHGDDAGAVPAPAEARSVVLVSASGEPSASVPPGPGRRDHLGPQPVRGPLSALAHLGILPCRPAAWGLVRTRPRQARLVPGAQSSCPRSPHLAGCCCPCDPGRRRPPPRRRSDPSTFLSSADDASPSTLSAGRTSPAGRSLGIHPGHSAVPLASTLLPDSSRQLVSLEAFRFCAGVRLRTPAAPGRMGSGHVTWKVPTSFY